MNKIFKFLSMIGVTLTVLGCGQKYESNAAYLHYLSGLIVDYQVKTGGAPESIDAAAEYAKVRLRNRGDLHGNGLIYVKLERAFLLRSYGGNNQDDLGLKDDVDVYMKDGAEVGRVEIIRYMKEADDGMLWQSFGHLFE